MSREIDRQIAELMGYKLKQVDHDEIVEIHPVHGEMVIPQYSTDWNAMRLLVEWLQGKKLRVEIDLLFNDEATCQLSILNLYGWSVISESARNYAESAPLALCRAVLGLPKEALA